MSGFATGPERPELSFNVLNEQLTELFCIIACAAPNMCSYRSWQLVLMMIYILTPNKRSYRGHQEFLKKVKAVNHGNEINLDYLEMKAGNSGFGFKARPTNKEILRPDHY